jgi:hypothetical protein
MDSNFESFMLYYVAWHDGEFGLSYEGNPDFGLRRMVRLLKEDVGQEGFNVALAIFGSVVQKRFASGIKKTIYQSIKDGELQIETVD